jgi:hypothetical protein
VCVFVGVCGWVRVRACVCAVGVRACGVDSPCRYFVLFYFVVQSFGFKDSKIIGSSESLLSRYAAYKRFLAVRYCTICVWPYVRES